LPRTPPSRVPGRKVGAIADLTAFSLYATKNIARRSGYLDEPRRSAEALDGCV